MATEIKLLRSDSRGIEGTLANIEHHAMGIKELVLYLIPRLADLGFKTWRQGNNIHEFVTSDGRRFTLRGYKRDGEYRGIRLSIRISRSNEHKLLDVENLISAKSLLETMHLIALSPLGEECSTLKSVA